MLTEEQSKLLSQLIDLSWEADNTANDYAERDSYREESLRVRNLLIRSMGVEAYMEFMDTGRRMFADKE
jgi:hypothetical protein